MAPFRVSSSQHSPPHAVLPCHTSSCFQQSLLPHLCQNSCVATAASSAYWNKLHFQKSSAHGDTTKGMLVKITAISVLSPLAAEFLESKFSLSSPPFQQQGLGFHTSSLQSRESWEITAQKLSLLLSFSFVTVWGGLSLSLSLLVLI